MGSEKGRGPEQMDRNTKRQSKGNVVESAPRGDRFMTSFPQDNASNMSLPDETGGKMGGSPTNLAHSLTGASAVQGSKGKASGV